MGECFCCCIEKNSSFGVSDLETGNFTGLWVGFYDFWVFDVEMIVSLVKPKQLIDSFMVK